MVYRFVEWLTLEQVFLATLDVGDFEMTEVMGAWTVAAT